ncbi:hypothetical protein JW977_04225 [Candidatus Falkowbacteria bacterium]|nr:hypothetical protein [Candidatus Falkowbacteria bacterium]
MAQISSQFANIFIHYYTNKASSTCKLFISEPNLALEEKMGRLFGILEVNLPSRENSHIIAELINALEETYYGEILNDSENLEISFENALEKVNQKFTQLISEKRFYLVGNLNENTIKEKINLAIGVLHGNKLCISYSNDIGIYLLHKTKQDFKTIDLKRINASAENTNKEPKLFSNFLEGELNPPDYLFLCNSNFLNFISLERIQKTITSLPLHKSAEYFKNSLLQTEGQNFAAIIIKNSTGEFEQAQISPSVTSISDLTKTETSTEKLLSPSFWSIIKSLLFIITIPFKKLYLYLQKKIAAHRLAAEQQALPNLTSDLPKGSYAKKPINILGLKLKRSSSKLLSKTPFCGEKMQKTKLWLRLKLIYIKSLLAKIPTFSKFLLIFAVILIILFLFSTTYFKHSQNNSTYNQEYQAEIEKIEQVISQAESDIIIGEENKAKEEVLQAQTLLAALPIKSQKQKDTYQELNIKIESVIAKLRHITNIEDPILIHDFIEEQNINLQNIVFSDNILVLFDSLNNNIFRYDLDSKEQKKFTSNLSDIGKIIKVKKVANQILAYHDKNGFVEYKDGKYLPLNVVLPTNAKIVDFAIYNDRLYSVDSANNQIYRQPKDESGYAGGATWLRNAFDMKNIISMGIDTNIWLLDGTGQLLKFNKGSQRNFTLKNVDPVLETPTQLITNDETNYIYVLEPKNNRIVVIDKEGNLATQYYSDKFDNLKAMDIFEKEKKMFLLNDNRILFVSLTHIK